MNDSEYSCDVVRCDRASHEDVASTRRALIAGEKSGEPQPFDPDQFKNEMMAKYRRQRH